MNLAIIPARSGSKRIKNKNIIDFHGKPIIFYSINAAIRSKLFDKIIVSTDSVKISKIAIKFGCETPFIRPNYLSGDKVPTIKVIKHAINFFKKSNIVFKNICCIYPSAPLITVDLLKKGFNLINDKKTNFSFPVTKYDYPIQRALELNNNYIKKMFNDNFYKSNSNNLKPYYHDCGQFYWGKEKAWLEEKKIFDKKSKIIEIPGYLGIDIDTNEDLKHAKIIYKYINE